MDRMYSSMKIILHIQNGLVNIFICGTRCFQKALDKRSLKQVLTVCLDDRSTDDIVECNVAKVCILYFLLFFNGRK